MSVIYGLTIILLTYTYHGSSDSLIGEGFLLLSGRKSKKSLILTKKRYDAKLHQFPWV